MGEIADKHGVSVREAVTAYPCAPGAGSVPIQPAPRPPPRPAPVTPLTPPEAHALLAELERLLGLAPDGTAHTRDPDFVRALGKLRRREIE